MLDVFVKMPNIMRRRDPLFFDVPAGRLIPDLDFEMLLARSSFSSTISCCPGRSTGVRRQTDHDTRAGTSVFQDGARRPESQPTAVARRKRARGHGSGVFWPNPAKQNRKTSRSFRPRGKSWFPTTPRSPRQYRKIIKWGRRVWHTSLSWNMDCSALAAKGAQSNRGHHQVVHVTSRPFLRRGSPTSR